MDKSQQRSMTLFGASAAILLSGMALIIFGADNAHASRWQVESSETGIALLPTVQISEVENKTLTLKSQTPGGTKVEFLCTGASVEGFSLQRDGLVSNVGKVKFSGCLTKLNNAISTPCQPHVGTEKGAITTRKLHGELLLHESAWSVRLEDFIDAILALVELGAECSIGESVPIIGKFSLQDPSFAKDSITHLVSPGPLTELWILSKTETTKAVPGGSVQIKMTGEQEGKRWGPSQVKGGPTWKVGGSDPQLSAFVDLFKVTGEILVLTGKTKGGTKVELKCTGGSVSFEALAKLTGCKVSLNGALSSPCEPNEKGQKGIVVTNKLQGPLLTQKEKVWSLQVEATGEVLAQVNLGEECAIGETLPVIGKFSLESFDLTEDSLSHLVSVESTSGLWVFSKSEDTKATLKGSATAEFGGINQGLYWSALQAGGIAGWKVGGSRVTDGLSPSVIVNELDTPLSLSATTFGGTGVAVSCTGAESISAWLKAEGKSSDFKIKFSGCTLSFNGKVSTECEPHTGSSKGVIVTEELRALLVLSEGKGSIQVVPKTGETVAIYETGFECALGSESKISRVFGTFALGDGALQKESASHLATVSATSSLTLWHNEGQKLKATLTGGAVLELFKRTDWLGLPE